MQKRLEYFDDLLLLSLRSHNLRARCSTCSNTAAVIWALRCSMRTNIAVTLYNSQYRRSAPRARTAFGWLLKRNLASRSCSATLQFGPLQSGKYKSRSKKRLTGTTVSNGSRIILATVITPLRKPCVPGRVRSRSMIASAAVTAPRAAHSNAIAKFPHTNSKTTPPK